MHGDLLCTDDHAYQRYRRLVNDPLLQATVPGAAARAGVAAAGAEGRRRSRQLHAATRTARSWT